MPWWPDSSPQEGWKGSSLGGSDKVLFVPQLGFLSPDHGVVVVFRRGWGDNLFVYMSDMEFNQPKRHKIAQSQTQGLKRSI